ncbi:MAG: molybdopterin dinucleotide binding domain-containing protein [Brooklawnia sp.]
MLRDDSKCELIVVIDMMMTSSARVADYVLPGVSNAEEEDLAAQGLAANMGYAILNNKVIEPYQESRGIYEIASGLAERFGQLDEFTEGRTHEEWVKETVEASRKINPGMPSYEELKDIGIWKKANPPRIALQEFRDDPEANPLPMASGKIELYSAEVEKKMATWQLPEGDVIAPVAAHVDTWEGAQEASQSRKYPLQMITHHFKGRTHTSYANVEWLIEAHPQQIWMSQVDAREWGITNRDTVEIFNDRGRMRIPAYVTPRMHPGVVSLPENAWYLPDKDGVDTGGCPNTLTRNRPSALAKTNPQYTNLVQIEKV